jgi:hypothetical protein
MDTPDCFCSPMHLSGIAALPRTTITNGTRVLLSILCCVSLHRYQQSVRQVSFVNTLDNFRTTDLRVNSLHHYSSKIRLYNQRSCSNQVLVNDQEAANGWISGQSTTVAQVWNSKSSNTEIVTLSRSRTMDDMRIQSGLTCLISYGPAMKTKRCASCA